MSPRPSQIEDELLGTLEGVSDFFKLYTTNKDDSTNPIIGHIHARVHIFETFKGWYINAKTRGVVARHLLLGSTVTGTPLHQMTIKDALESIQYQDASQASTRHLGLDHAICSWSV